MLLFKNFINGLYGEIKNILRKSADIAGLQWVLNTLEERQEDWNLESSCNTKESKLKRAFLF